MLSSQHQLALAIRMSLFSLMLAVFRSTGSFLRYIMIVHVCWGSQLFILWKVLQFLALELSGLFPKLSIFQGFFTLWLVYLIPNRALLLSTGLFRLCAEFCFPHSETDVRGHGDQPKKWKKWWNNSNVCGERWKTGSPSGPSGARHCIYQESSGLHICSKARNTVIQE